MTVGELISLLTIHPKNTPVYISVGWEGGSDDMAVEAKDDFIHIEVSPD